MKIDTAMMITMRNVIMMKVLERMGEGASLSFPRNGFSIDNHPYSVVSVPFTRDYFFSPGSKVPDLTDDGECVPKWSDEAPCSDLQKTALSGLFSVGSKVGGRRLSSSLGRGVVKMDIHLYPVVFVPFIRVLECSGGRNLPDQETPSPSGFGWQDLVFTGAIPNQANWIEKAFSWVPDLVLAYFQDPLPGDCGGLSLDSHVDEAKPTTKTAGGNELPISSSGYSGLIRARSEPGFPDRSMATMSSGWRVSPIVLRCRRR